MVMSLTFVYSNGETVGAASALAPNSVMRFVASATVLPPTPVLLLTIGHGDVSGTPSGVPLNWCPWVYAQHEGLNSSPPRISCTMPFSLLSAQNRLPL